MFNAVAVDDRINRNFERLLINYVSKFYSESLKYIWYMDNVSSNFWLCIYVCLCTSLFKLLKWWKLKDLKVNKKFKMEVIKSG